VARFRAAFFLAGLAFFLATCFFAPPVFLEGAFFFASLLLDVFVLLLVMPLLLLSAWRGEQEVASPPYPPIRAEAPL
jgi:hypothetical protein